MYIAKFREKQCVYNVNNKRSGVIEKIYTKKYIDEKSVVFDIRYKIKTDTGVEDWREEVIRSFPEDLNFNPQTLLDLLRPLLTK